MVIRDTSSEQQFEQNSAHFAFGVLPLRCFKLIRRLPSVLMNTSLTIQPIIHELSGTKSLRYLFHLYACVLVYFCIKFIYIKCKYVLNSTFRGLTKLRQIHQTFHVQTLGWANRWWYKGATILSPIPRDQNNASVVAVEERRGGGSRMSSSDPARKRRFVLLDDFCGAQHTSLFDAILKQLLK